MKIITTWERVPVVMSLAYASCLLGSDPESLRRMAVAQTFPAFKVGKNWKVQKDDMQQWIKTQTDLRGS